MWKCCVITVISIFRFTMAHRIHPPVKMYHELKFVHLEALRQPTKILTGDGYNQTARFNGILGDITIMFVPTPNAEWSQRIAAMSSDQRFWNHTGQLPSSGFQNKRNSDRERFWCNLPILVRRIRSTWVTTTIYWHSSFNHIFFSFQVNSTWSYICLSCRRLVPECGALHHTERRWRWFCLHGITATSTPPLLPLMFSITRKSTCRIYHSLRHWFFKAHTMGVNNNSHTTH